MSKDRWFVYLFSNNGANVVLAANILETYHRELSQDSFFYFLLNTINQIDFKLHILWAMLCRTS